MLPLGFQLWQLSIANHEAQLALYQKVRMFKAAAFAGAVCLSMWQLTTLKKQWMYYDRFYPEPTELQKTLHREALLYKELDY